MSTDEQPAPDEPDTPGEGIFSPLIGHDGAKAILRSSLRRGDVHILLSGPPASGKSVALLAIEEAIDGAQYVDARGFTERKLRDTLANNPPVLLIDEFDNMKTEAFKALNTALEQGRVTKQVTGDAYDVGIETQVFVACNYPDKLPGDVSDRFVLVDFDAYTRDEYIDVCAALLPEQVTWVRDHQNPDEAAREIARVVWEQTDSRSPRTARDAARLADRPRRVPAIVAAMNDPKADVDSEPVTPDELPHNDRADDSTTRRPTSLEEVRENMADPDDIESRSVDEIDALLGGGGDDDDAGDTISGGDPGGESADEPSPDGEESQDDGVSLDVDTGYDSGQEYIEDMIQSGNRIIPNSFPQTGVGIIYPEEYSDAIQQLVGKWKIDPEAAGVYPQTPKTVKEEFGEEVADDLETIQFIADDVEDIRSTGYDINQIVDALKDEPVLVSVTGTLRDRPVIEE